MNKKVLIITYYWPPVGGSGVQRWLKMSKYIRDKGWEPVIYTPENSTFGTYDETLLQQVPKDIEIIRVPIWEPYHLFARLKGKKGAITASDVRIKENKSWLDKLMLFIRGNFFIPDPRVFWRKPSLKVLPDIIKSNDIQAVITTGPPHSLHLIGLKLKHKIDIPWVADFRDPWTEWDLYENFYMLPFIKSLHKKLERRVLQKADKVFTVNASYKDQLEKLGERPVDLVSNGYDEADFRNYQYTKSDKFSIRHIGIIDEMRDPSPFILALKRFVKNKKNIEVEFIGNVSETFQEKIKNDAQLNAVITFTSHQPHHRIIEKYSETELLLLILTRSSSAAGNTPGKVYEYLASGAHILAIGPTYGEVADILEKTQAGMIKEPLDIDGIQNALETFYLLYEKGTRPQTLGVEQYSRRHQAYRVANNLDELT